MAFNFTPNSVTLFQGSSYLLSFVGSNVPSIPNVYVGYIFGSTPNTVPGMLGIPDGTGPEGLNFYLGGSPPGNPGTPTTPGTFTFNLALFDEFDNQIPNTETTITVEVSSCLVTVPPNVILPTEPGVCGATYNFPPGLPSISGVGCTGILTTSHASGSFFPKGVTVVQAYVDLGDGPILVPGKSFTVTVEDTEKPVFTSCPTNIIVDATSPDGAIVNYVTPTATDNCPGVNVFPISGQLSGALFPVGLTITQYRAVDTSGNFAEQDCIFNVTVNPYVPPPIVVKKKKNIGFSCPPTINVASSGTPPSQVRFGGCGVYQNPIANPSASQKAGSILYTYTRVITQRSGRTVWTGDFTG